MAAGSATSARSPRPALRRDLQRRMVGGVCGGLARHLGLDVLLVRVAFVAAAAAGGLGVALYIVLWLTVPPGEADAPPRRLPGPGAVEVALGVGLLVLSALLTVRAAGLWFSDAVAWPLVLIAAGGALIWRQSAGAVERLGPAPGRHPAPAPPDRAGTVSRTGVGVALVIAAGIAFLQSTGTLGALRDAALVALAVAVVLAVIFAPWAVRLVRSLGAEREQRARAQERAEMAAHLHDSVLQTLALVQRRAADPREVATLARRQERELRAWLADRTPRTGEARLAAALEAAADEVERAHGVEVEVVAVGDAALDERGQAVIAAAREAIVNAAKFGGGSPVDVYAEAEDGRLQVFVRDRGPGFDPAAVPSDRRGVRESIVGRMTRHGGTATIRSTPGAGTEVELLLEQRAQ